jgi:DNA-binding HxlR family transcriptional regulator
MVVLDLLGRRGTLRIAWELRHGTPMTFRALQAAAGSNPSVLNTRLAELREAGLVEHDGDGYVLTPLGGELLAALRPLGDWAARWAAARARAERSASGRS